MLLREEESVFSRVIASVRLSDPKWTDLLNVSNVASMYMCLGLI